MKSEIKTKWIEALRSGDYQQGTGELIGSGCYCIYGVLSSLYAAEHELDVYRVIDQNTADHLIAPKEVTDWAGLPEVMINDNLVRKNDLERLSFGEIADFIEDNTKGEQ